MSPVLLVVLRELREKVRSRAFWVMNLLIMALVLGAVILPALLADDTPEVVRIGGVGDDAALVLAIAAGQAPAFGFELEIGTVSDEATGRTLLEDDQLDLVLLGAGEVVGLETPRGDRVQLLDGARRLALLDGALADAGLDEDARAALLVPEPLRIVGLNGDDDGPDPVAVGIGLAAVALLYGLIIFYGQQVAQGIVQEKQSRVIEVLLATMRPVQLLGGKLLGLGLLGLAQVASLALAVGIGVAVTGREGLPEQALPTVYSAVLWFLLGFGLYATLFALAAAVVAKAEDLQTAMMGPIILLVGSFVLAQLALANPEGTMATVAALLPTSAPMAQPLRVALGTSTPATVALGALSVVGTTAVIIPIAARAHAGAALSVRQRISVREALRRSRA